MEFLLPLLPQIAGLVGLGAFMGGTTGIESATQVTNLRNSLCSLNKNVSSITADYNSLLQTQNTTLSDLNTKLKSYTTDTTNIVNEISAYKFNYDNVMKQLDTNAILFVATLALLYIIAKFKLLNLIFEAI
jgi:hypothetical protein